MSVVNVGTISRQKNQIQKTTKASPIATKVERNAFALLVFSLFFRSVNITKRHILIKMTKTGDADVWKRVFVDADTAQSIAQRLTK